MGLIFRTHILILAVLFCALNSLKSQCSFPSNLPIADDSTSVYDINISGAINNDLSTNGICGISIRFRHNIIGDVELKLISPSGQEVTLLGPTAPLSNLTTFTVWDIFFTPCGSAAAPDFPFSPIFNNLELWGQLAQYDGTYYPNQGCLEDFDQGSVNGIWQLVVSDVNQFDEGIIESFELFFCDDSGVDCESCEAESGIILNEDLIACQGDSSLLLEIETLFVNGPSDSMAYTNEFVVFNDSSLFEYSIEPDLISYPAGIYTICNLDVNSDQITLLPPQGTLVNAEEYLSFLNQSGACAEINDSCFIVQILSPAVTINISEEICLGDTLDFFGLKVFEEGTYNVNRGEVICDSLYILNLDVINTNPNITANQAGIECVNDSVTLTVAHGEMDKLVQYNWDTNNGNIISDQTQQNIIVDTVGWYFVETSVDNCIQVDSFEVVFADTLPTITLTSDTVDCILADATITLNSSKPLIQRDWTGPGILAEGLFTLKVGLPGVYTLLGTDADGCVAEVSIEVPGSIDPPGVSFDVNHLGCDEDSASIAIQGIVVGDTINWLNYTNIESDSFAYFTSTGTFFIQSIGQNGCDRIDTITIQDFSYDIDVDVLDDTITCLIPVVEPDVSIFDSIGLTTYLWTFPSSNTSQIPEPSLDEIGIYDLLITDSNMCTGQAQFEVFEDIEPPEIMVMDTIFTCIDDSIQIGILNPNPSFNYFWDGPLGYESTEEEPFIYYAGNYSVVVTGQNGCRDTALITVIEGADLPTSSFQIIDLDCLTDTARIISIDTAGLLFEFESPFLLSPPNEPNALISEGGFVFLTITERSTDCSNYYEFFVEDFRSYIDIEISIDTITCSKDTVIPRVIFSDEVVNLEWSGPESFLDTFPSITIPGTYTLEVQGSNGCVSNDSVTVFDDKDLPVITIDSDTLFCIPDSVIQIAEAPNASRYEWYFNGQFFANSDSITVYEGGLYKVIVEGENGCIDSLETILVQDTIPPIFTLDVDAIISCEDSISTLVGSVFDPIYTYVWTGPGIVFEDNNSIDVNEGGIYTLEVTDQKGCSYVDSIMVIDERQKPSFEVSINNINCYSLGLIELNELQNVDSIFWSGPQSVPINAQDAVISEPGTYIITTKSILGCEVVTTIDVGLDTITPIIFGTIDDTINCENQEVQIDLELISDADSLYVEGPEIIQTDSLAILELPGVYNLSLVSENGCSLDTTIQIVADTVHPQVQIVGDTLTCLKSRVLLTLDNYDNIVEVNWSGPGVNENGFDLLINQIGAYSAEVIGSNGCVTLDSIIITEDKEKPTIQLQDTFYLPCNGDSIMLDVITLDEIETYRWIGNGFFSEDPNPMVGEPIQIVVFASGANGCNTVDSTVVVEDDRIISFDVLFDSITCSQKVSNLIPIDVDDDESYYWEFPDGSIIENQFTSTVEGGIHKLVVNGGNECYDSIEFNVLVDTLTPQVEIVYEDSIQCENTEVEIIGLVSHANPNYTFSWSTLDGNFVGGLETLSPIINSEGTYMLTVMDTINGCTSISSIEIVEENQTFSDFIFEAFDPFCKGESTGLIEIIDYLNPVGEVSLYLDGVLQNSTNIEGLSPGTYQLVAIDEYGCEIVKLVEIGEGLSYDIQIVGDTIMQLGDSILLEVFPDNSSIFLDSISWYTTESIICEDCSDTYVQLSENTFVIVESLTEEGCIARDSILIKVTSEIDFEFPTIFSPNDDGVNDLFKIPNLKEFERIERLLIFDRWGNIMYRQEDITFEEQEGWDGKLDGRYVLPGVYVVLLDVRLKNGRVVKTSTDLTLIR